VVDAGFAGVQDVLEKAAVLAQVVKETSPPGASALTEMGGKTSSEFRRGGEVFGERLPLGGGIGAMREEWHGFIVLGTRAGWIVAGS